MRDSTTATSVRFVALALLVFACGDDDSPDMGSGGVDRADGGGAKDGGETPDPDASGAGGRGGRGGRGGSGGKGGASGSEADAGSGGAGGMDAGDGGGGGTPDNLACRPVTAESLPARAAVLRAPGSSGEQETGRWYRRQDLCDLFDNASTCGGCHWGKDDPLGTKGVFQYTCATIGQRPNFVANAYERIWSTDPDRVMPPSSDASKLAKDSEIAILADMLRAWQDQGNADLFYLDRAGTQDTTAPEDAYALDEELGNALTNIGSCIPSPDLPQLTDDMRAKDALFAAIKSFADLPTTLYGTDFISLDSEVLGQHGVYSYAPTYTLFSDHASKMRYVRVPVGQAIKYNQKTRDFDIPENTRFYKTFLKEVVDKDGKKGFRKMETRLIVSRRSLDFDDGRPSQVRAIRASYAWDKDERMATLVSDSLRDQTPFADRLCPYVVDENGNRDTNGDGTVDKKDGNPVDASNPQCTYMDGAALEDPKSGTVRHYAIPGRTRCDECHMGSSSRSYILGFTPWHADRRPAGEGGTFDHPPSEDELSQLRRLIDYGVVSGIQPGVAKLEDSQGERKPRNDHELTAQGYMMGNCAFCHNERGFPSVQNPVLAPFKMFPDRDDGGIFQFSLDRHSPRAAHIIEGEGGGSIAIPYITSAFGMYGDKLRRTAVGGGSSGTPLVIEQDTGEPAPDYAANIDTFYQLGPWRSLIWRNVYTPFTYPEGSALFIHMPRNVPGFDVRAHRIMANWMLSIPSRPKPAENVTPVNPDDASFAWLWNSGESQPAEEVLPEDTDYAEAKAAAQARVDAYLMSVTGQHQPPDTDILDPAVLNSQKQISASGTELILNPAPRDDQRLSSPRVHPKLLEPAAAGTLHNAHADDVPDHAHWVVVDTTDLPGVWQPRRGNWRDLIAVEKSEYASAEYQRTLDQIRKVKLTPEQEALSLTPVPLGLWADRCSDYAAEHGAQTVQQLRQAGPAPMRKWLEDVPGNEEVTVDAYVHTMMRGQAVFTAICQNCHGPAADSKSPLATTIMELTGGTTRVANFVDGLFGPRTSPGFYADREFIVEGSDGSPDDWHARYMLFMALGGTEKTIPQAVLGIVGVSPFYGRSPRTGSYGIDGANMLVSAQQACRAMLDESASDKWKISRTGLVQDFAKTTVFVKGTGHFELWESLCSFGNEPLVREFSAQLFGLGVVYRSKDDAGAWVYPTDALVGDAFGRLERGIQPGNTRPWCIRRAGADEAAVQAAMKDLGYDAVPWCPEAIYKTRYSASPSVPGKPIHLFPLGAVSDQLNGLFAQRWYRRGAMNAGLAAYYYLDRWTKGQISPATGFDACEGSSP